MLNLPFLRIPKSASTQLASKLLPPKKFLPSTQEHFKDTCETFVAIRYQSEI